MNRVLTLGMLLAVLHGTLMARGADKFANHVGSVLQARCAKCHGKQETEGDVDLNAIKSQKDILAQPELIRRMIEAVDAFDMPPETEPEFPELAPRGFYDEHAP